MARVGSFTNFMKRLVVRVRLNDSNSSHNLISFDKQFHARGPLTTNAHLPKISCLNFGNLQDTCFNRFYGIISAFCWGHYFLDVATCKCLAMKSLKDDQQCFEFNLVFDAKPVKWNECRGYQEVHYQEVHSSCFALSGSPFNKLLQ